MAWPVQEFKPGVKRMPKSIIENLLQSDDFPEGECWRVEYYPAQVAVICKGEESKNLFFIIEGEVRVSGNVEMDDGREFHPGFTTLGKGEVFGELVLFDNLPRSASVETMSEVKLAVIDGQCLMDYMQENRDIGFEIVLAMVKSLVGRLRQTNEQLFAIYAWGLKIHDIDKHL
jgi:CRP-like cAMP-binding protein